MSLTSPNGNSVDRTPIIEIQNDGRSIHQTLREQLIVNWVMVYQGSTNPNCKPGNANPNVYKV